MPLSPGTRPRRESGEPRIERDLSGQILELDVPEPYWQPRIMPSLVQFRNRSEMVSAATLVQKAKQFDDGLYAAVELAALHGCGDRAAKTAWLARLRRALGTDQAATSLYAAARMLDADADVPGPLAESVAKRGRDFLEDERASKPISFYTWTEELAALFRHDRLLQGELRTRELEPLVRALHAEPAVRDQYERYLGLIEQLTNPLTEDAVRRSLRALDEGTEPSLDRASFIPASVSHESELIKRMYGDTPIPEGFELMTELIDRVRSGSIDLSPTADSGWYDHQTWSLAPLARPEDTPEAERLRFTNAYRKHLEDLFKGTWALARETHAKQIDSPMVALLELPPEPARPELVVQPDLSCEPLVTHYRRRADSYRFVRAVVEDYFGTASLRSIHRQTADGAVDSSLDEELAFMTDLFDGAASTCEHEIGASFAELGDEVFRQWNCSDDPDLGTDVRMMVPIFYDVQRAMTKVWVVLGWSERGLNVSFRQPPSITIRDDAGEDITARYDIKFGSRRYSIAYPEFAEVYVKRILHRDEFRALCDEHGTREKILAAL